MVRDKELQVESWRIEKPCTQSVQRGKGVPMEREVNMRREVCEWEG